MNLEKNNKANQYIKELKKAYIERGGKEKWDKIEQVAIGISEEDKDKLLKEYPEMPETLLNILEQIDGTYYRKYNDVAIFDYFFGSDIEEGGYPYYLLSAEQMLETKDDAARHFDYFINREFDNIPVSEEITNDINNIKWIHFSDCMNNGGTSQLFIDLSPSCKGKKGQIIRMIHDEDGLEVIANSFDEFLDKLIDNGMAFIHEDEF